MNFNPNPPVFSWVLYLKFNSFQFRGAVIEIIEPDVSLVVQELRLEEMSNNFINPILFNALSGELSEINEM